VRAAELARWVGAGLDHQAVGDHVVPGLLAPVLSAQKKPRKHGSAETLLMSARAKSRT
jgi:hypothetical protein